MTRDPSSRRPHNIADGARCCGSCTARSTVPGRPAGRRSALTFHTACLPAPWHHCSTGTRAGSGTCAVQIDPQEPPSPSRVSTYRVSAENRFSGRAQRDRHTRLGAAAAVTDTMSSRRRGDVGARLHSAERVRVRLRESHGTGLTKRNVTFTVGRDPTSARQPFRDVCANGSSPTVS